MEEIILIDKPVGISSFDVIRRLRKEIREYGRILPSDEFRGASEALDQDVSKPHTLRERTSEATKKFVEGKVRMGHAGTLDPLASGLMIIGIGAGTKKLNEYLKLPKEYITEILVGEKRATGDMEGGIVEEREVAEIFSAEKISATLAGMIGTLALPVSAYSAIKKDGVPLYKRVRAGKPIEELPVRKMEVKEAEYMSHEQAGNRCVVKVRFHVGSGTYIRSLGEEFGKRLGYPATLKSLRRTKIGDFDIKNARTI